jgi:hypothetical protein
VLRETTPVAVGLDGFIAYGAICVPDASSLIIRDNTISDFGAQPGVPACGIYVLHAEMVEISRNHVLESRDWALAQAIATQTATGIRGGIVVMLATPPTYGSALSLDTPIYEPGFPALRVEHNVARVPLGESLAAVGIGSFSVVNNHFSCGGRVSPEGALGAQTVLILNLGTALEGFSSATTPSGTYGNAPSGSPTFSAGKARGGTAGSVVFTDNICQLEARIFRTTENASVLIYTPDHLIFANNQSWLDGARFTVLADALLIAGSLNVIGNRFQESPNSVLLSGLTAGVVNITSENISTYCLFAIGVMLIDANNIAIITAINSELCSQLYRLFGGK